MHNEVDRTGITTGVYATRVASCPQAAGLLNNNSTPTPMTFQRYLAVAALIGATIGLAGCGGGGGGGDSTSGGGNGGGTTLYDVPTQVDVKSTATGAASRLDQGGAVIEVLTLNRSAARQVQGTVYEYQFEPVVLASSKPSPLVQVELKQAGAGTTVVDGRSTAANLPLGESLVLKDALVVQHDRSKPFDLAALQLVLYVQAPIAYAPAVDANIFRATVQEGSAATQSNPIQVLQGGSASGVLVLMAGSAGDLLGLDWLVESDPSKAFSVSSHPTGATVQVRGSTAPSSQPIRAQLRAVRRATGESRLIDVYAVVNPSQATAAGQLTAQGLTLQVDGRSISFSANQLTEPAYVTVVVGNSSAGDWIYEISSEQDLVDKGVKVSLPALPEVDSLPYSATSPQKPSEATSQGKTGERRFEAVSPGCATTTSGTYSAGSLNTQVLNRRAYFVYGLRAKEGSPLDVSNLRSGATYTYQTQNGRRNHITVVQQVASALDSSIAAASSCGISNSAELLQSFNWLNHEPVIFVHGYTLGDNLGGGEGTWGRFPAVASMTQAPSGATLVPFEFRWRSNTDFRTAASDLGKAINFLHRLTGKRVHVVAHSFGGVLSRTLLQGLAYDIPTTRTIDGDMTGAKSRVASLTSLGSPYSGVLASNTQIVGAGYSAYLPAGRDAVTINACRQISCVQMGEDSTMLAQHATALGYDAEDQRVAGHSARLAATSDQLPAIQINVGIGLTKRNDRFTTGDKLISFAGQRFRAYSSDQVANEMPLFDGVRVGAATVNEVVLGEGKDARPGGAPLPPEVTVTTRTAGYLHTGGVFLNRNDGDNLSDYGLQAAVQEGCATLVGCRHAGVLLFRQTMGDYIGLGHITAAKYPPMPAAPLTLNPERIAGLADEDVQTLRSMLRAYQAGNWVSGNSIRWANLPADTVVADERNLRRILPRNADVEARIDAIQAQQLVQLQALNVFGSELLASQNAFFVVTDESLRRLRDVAVNSVKAGFAVAEIANSSVAGAISALRGRRIRSDSSFVLQWERLRKAAAGLDWLALTGGDCVDVIYQVQNLATVPVGAEVDIGATSEMLFGLAKCVAKGLSDADVLRGEAAKTFVKVLTTTVNLDDGAGNVNALLVFTDVGSTLLDLAPANPVVSAAKGTLDFINSTASAVKAGIEMANITNTVVTERMHAALEVWEYLRREVEIESTKRILAVRAQNLYMVGFDLPTIQASTVTPLTGQSVTFSLAGQFDALVDWASRAAQVVWEFGTSIGSQVVAVVNGVADFTASVAQAFADAGTAIVQATFRTASDIVLGRSSIELMVTAAPPTVTDVQPRIATSGVAQTFTVTGANLPQGLAFVLNECQGITEVLVGGSASHREFTCTFPVGTPTSTVEGSVSTGSSPFGAPPLLEFTVNVTAAPSTSADFSDEFASLDLAKWTVDGISPGQVGAVSVSGGVAQFGAFGRMSTNRKVEFSGQKIVIEARMAGSGSQRDTGIKLVDAANTNNAIYSGDTSYCNWGLYASGGGDLELTEGAFECGGATRVRRTGASTSQFMEYRWTIDGNRLTVERGATLANITDTMTVPLETTIAGRAFFLSIGTAGTTYSPGSWDWVRVTTCATSTDSRCTSSSTNLITFEELPSDMSAMVNVPGSLVPAGSRLTNQYLTTHGVAFTSSGGFAALINHGAGNPTASNPNVIGGSSADGRQDFNAPITISFFSVADVSIKAVTNRFKIQGDWFPLGSGRVFATAFDVSGNVIGTTSDTDNKVFGVSGPVLAFNVAGIHRVVISADNGTTGFDQLEFGVVSQAASQQSVSRLPHTGITANQCYAAGSNTLVSCASPAALALNSQQDGMRAGINAMAYSRVGSYDLTECVRDNVTGLMWEGKTAAGTRAGSNTYANFGDGSARDASAYVATVNASGLCGYSDWRLPTADELQSLVDYGVAYPAPTIAAAWFPNTAAHFYWSSSPYAGDSGLAWGVRFNDGYVVSNNRNNSYQVRLVRASQ